MRNLARGLLSVAVLAVLPGLAFTALAESTWSFVTIPDLPEGAYVERGWASGPDDVYVWAEWFPPMGEREAYLYHWDGSSWTRALHLTRHNAGLAAGQVFGTGPADVFASAFSFDTSNPRMFHYDGFEWTEQTLPSQVNGINCNRILGIVGEPGTVYASLSCQTYWSQRRIRHDELGWQFVQYGRDGSWPAWISGNEMYFLSCWGHLLYHDNLWTWHRGFDFCDVWNVWGMRDDDGVLHLYAAGANNFNNGVRVWRYEEDYPGSMTGSWGSKYGTDFSDPPGYGWRDAGCSYGIWGSGPEDVYVVGWRDKDIATRGRVYHYDGTDWQQLTAFGDIPSAYDVFGSGPDDVWISLSDGRLLHYGPLGCQDPAPLSQGYWHRQCLGLPEGEGGIDPGRNGRGPTEPTEPDFVDVCMPCAETRLQDLGYYGMETCEGMDADPPSDPCERAYKQLTALILNVCSDRLEDGCEVDATAAGCSATTVGDLIDEVAGLIDGGLCSQAADCAAAVNEGDGLAAGGGAETTVTTGDDDVPSVERPGDRRRGGRRIWR